ncbi:glycosyltransferase family 2 protein [Ligilactobacillus acidipiscis]|uniref:Glycosyltransferase n=1 Tax=Ligilactobacillus acidipiscis TaxID=89059 RepID=A0A0R2K6Y7_9LACO|nr:glycosyltransferase family 2 protein [Ligilactobacillus acidipiscis]KRN82020.1 glycosyltransferase [Ligilactobacillus acidipiscis]
MSNNTLTIVVPCFNEEEVLPETTKELGQILTDLMSKGKISEASKILFVNDGSKDKTWEIISDYCTKFNYVAGIKFSRNYGHQNALIAGMTTANDYSDMVITIDADLQDDVNAIPEMVDKYLEGYDVVYGVRNSRETDTVFKRKTALAYYSIMGKLGVKLVPNSADYRLLSKRATSSLLQYKEHNLFLRGMVPLVGYRSTKVYYARKERYAGESKYPLKKMMNFAFDGITSFSVAPIHLIMNLGILIVLVSLIMMIYVLVRKGMGDVVTGWSSLMVSIWFVGGVQLISISMIGEYVGKVFSEVKQRPRYVIEEDKFTPKAREEHKK